MTTSAPGRLVILSGPSCVGKSPLARALARFHPELNQRLQKLVLFNSRAPRSGEADGVDYHFRTRRQIEAMRSEERFAVLDVRGDAFFEGNPFVGRLLQTHPALARVRRLSVFVSPLSKEEILFLKDPARNAALPELITDVMRRKLLRRTRRQKGELSLKDLENIEQRAGSAFRELQEACHFEWVIPNHDGEDSDNWDAFYYPLGDARKTLLAFVDLSEGRVPVNAEKWEAGLIV
jgi:guanylate kinase